MNVERYKAENLKPLFRRHGVLMMSELKKALGTDVDMTVFRKLKVLVYRTSYSHGGRYYTLDELAQFDDRGLWCRKGVWFSRHGTLLATLEAFVKESQAGYFADELRGLLHVEVKESLLRLVNKGLVDREMFGRRYLYSAPNITIQRRQLRKRRTEASVQSHGAKSRESEEVRTGTVSDEVKAALVLFVSLLDEKQRRLYAGLEALRVGLGGDQEVAKLLGLHPQTVAKGRQELLDQDVDVDRVRRSGGGRKPVEKKRRRSSKQSKS